MATDNFALKDSVEELLDKGFTVRLFRNRLGSITAEAVHNFNENFPEIDTDDFSTIRVLHRLTEKVLRNRIVTFDDEGRDI